ncbi:MAG: hypothetical protein ACF787_08815 [Rhodopirellula sp. JB053]
MQHNAIAKELIATTESNTVANVAKTFGTSPGPAGTLGEFRYSGHGR